MHQNRQQHTYRHADQAAPKPINRRNNPEHDPGNQEQQHIGLRLAGAFAVALITAVRAFKRTRIICARTRCRAKKITPVHHQVEIALHGIQMLHERFISSNLAACN